jgi:hypothetical protein
MESSAFPDELVREIAVLTPYLGPEMATRLGAFWECCWVHGIDPRNLTTSISRTKSSLSDVTAAALFALHKF